MNREIVYGRKIESAFPPLERRTLAVEAKLSQLRVENGRMQGVKPLNSRVNGNPANCGFIKICGITLLVYLEEETIVVWDLLR